MADQPPVAPVAQDHVGETGAGQVPAILLSDAELRNITRQAGYGAGDDRLQRLLSHIRAQTAQIGQLKEDLETERVGPWPEWAVRIKDRLQKLGVDYQADDEIHLAVDFEIWVEGQEDECKRLIARAEKAEAESKASGAALNRFQNEVWGILDCFMKRMGTGIGGHQPEAWAMVSDAIADRERLMQQFGVPSQAMIDVAAERRRHVEVEGWTPEHDDEHGDGSMARAAASYAYVAGISERERTYVSGIFTLSNNRIIRDIWPWAQRWWKPKDRYTDLKRAAALCIAEMERLLRKEARNG